MKLTLFIVLCFTLFTCNSQSERTETNENLVDSLALELNDAALEMYRNYTFGIDTDINNLELAIQELNQAIEIEPEVALYYSNKAQILITMGKKDEAKTTFKKVLEFQPDHAEILSGIGFIYEGKGNKTEAHKWYERSFKAYQKRIEENNYVVNSKIHLVFLNFFLQDEEAAVNAFNELKDLYPESDEVLFIEDFFLRF